ncbi:MAG: YggT family protein [Spirochaetales bacterium]|nr:YggT family protein [Spirochaetales bacterium]
MQTIMKITSSVITAYMLLIFLRVLLTWFRGPEVGRPIELLGKITDPYLNYFRRFKWLKVAEIDFSPIAAIILLIILTNFTSTIGALGTITLGITLALVIGSIWSGASWILTFFIIITIIRFIALLLQRNTASPFIHTLDMILRPVTGRIPRLFFRDRLITYQTALATTAASLIIVNILGNLITGQAIRLLSALPF